MSEDQFDIDDELLEDEQQGPKETIKRLWNENPLFKVGVVVVAIVAIYIGYSVFFSDDQANLDVSHVPGAQEVTSAPGEEDTDPEYQEALEDANRQRAEEATASGGSSLPTPIGSSDARIEAPNLEDLEGENPLDVWQRRSDAVDLGRDDFAEDDGPDSSGPSEDFDLEDSQMSLTPHRQMQPRMPQETVSAPKGDNENIERFAEQMRAIISTKQPPSPNLIALGEYPSPYQQYLNQQQEMATMQQSSTEEGAQSTGLSTPYLEDDVEGDDALAQEEEEKKEKVIIPAGTIVYAQVLNALNSDINSPVLAQILSGPLTGSRAIGSFERQDEYLVLNFERIVDDDDVYGAEAYALDTGTTLAGIRSDVDRHWIRRVVLPAAAEFIAGMGTAVAEAGSTNVTVDQGAAVSEQSDLDTEQEIASGIESGAEKFSEILEGEDDVEITVTLKKGTPIGIVFTESIKEGDLE
ncbi:MAG: TrbI/VirB10 family protein [Pseudomonadota bacterium]